MSLKICSISVFILQGVICILFKEYLLKELLIYVYQLFQTQEFIKADIVYCQ